MIYSDKVARERDSCYCCCQAFGYIHVTQIIEVDAIFFFTCASRIPRARVHNILLHTYHGVFACLKAGRDNKKIHKEVYEEENKNLKF